MIRLLPLPWRRDFNLSWEDVALSGGIIHTGCERVGKGRGDFKVCEDPGGPRDFNLSVRIGFHLGFDFLSQARASRLVLRVDLFVGGAVGFSN